MEGRPGSCTGIFIMIFILYWACHKLYLISQCWSHYLSLRSGLIFCVSSSVLFEVEYCLYPVHFHLQLWCS